MNRCRLSAFRVVDGKTVGKFACSGGSMTFSVESVPSGRISTLLSVGIKDLQNPQ